MHQHGGAGWPVARASAWAHRFGCPHRGQRVGSGMGSGGVIRVVFCGMKRRAARAAQAFGKSQERVTMSQALTAPQLDELKQRLLARRQELHAQMAQNRANLAPAENTAGSVSQDENARLANQTREVDTRLTALDADELARIDRALEAMDAGDYGLCDACGCAIPFERLKIEPMTQHCVACKSAWEHKKGIARA